MQLPTLPKQFLRPRVRGEFARAFGAQTRMPNAFAGTSALASWVEWLFGEILPIKKITWQQGKKKNCRMLK
jgi:hypothetical protein